MSMNEQQAVLIHLDGTNLPAEVYEQYDLMTLEMRLMELLEGQDLGEFDGNEIGPGEATLFFYGPDADALFSAVEPVLTAYPLCRNARVVLRRGGLGSPESEFRLPA